MEQITTKQEVILLRSALAGLIGKDKEGTYRPEFVAEIYASLSRTPKKRFTSASDFLDDVAKA